MTKREILSEMGYDESVVFESPDYDSAIIGVDSNGRVVYSFELMVKDLMEKDGMDQDEDIEFIEFNTIGALPSCSSDKPIVMYDLIELE